MCINRVSLVVTKTRVRRQSRCAQSPRKINDACLQQKSVSQSSSTAGPGWACWLSPIGGTKDVSHCCLWRWRRRCDLRGRVWAFFFFFFLTRCRTAGLEVTAGTGKHACPSPAVSMPRHEQMSVKDNLAASWRLQELPFLLQLYNLCICRVQVHLFSFGVGSFLC